MAATIAIYRNSTCDWMSGVTCAFRVHILLFTTDSAVVGRGAVGHRRDVIMPSLEF